MPYRRMVGDTEGLRKYPGEHETGALAAREARDRRARLLRPEQEILHVADDVLFLARYLDPVAAAAGEEIGDGVDWIERGAGLVERGHLDIGAEPHAARVGFELASQEIDQRRLARAVGADEAETVSAQHA